MPSQITQFDKQNLAEIRRAVDAALAKVGGDFGISLSLGNIKFSGEIFHAKLNAGIINSATGVAITPEQKALELHGKSYLGENFDPSKIYLSASLQRVQFVGIAVKSSKYPVIYKDVESGKLYKTSVHGAKFIVNYGSQEDGKAGAQ